ncbi:protein of unknown function (DUF1772) domain containing protein [Amanita muscaria]
MTSLKVAQATAIITSAFASGGILTISFLSVPALLLPARPTPGSQASSSPPSHLISQVTQQWCWAYNMGKVVFPSLAASSALAYTYLAYALKHSKISQTYLAAAVVTMSIAPYTLAVMLPTNKRLMERAARKDVTPKQQGEQEENAQQREHEDREIPDLMVKWAWMNAIRGLFPLVGAVIGASAAL